MAFHKVRLMLVFTYIAVLCAGSYGIWNYSQNSLYQTHSEQLDRFAEFVTSKLDKYAHIPRLIAKDSELINALFAPNNSAQIEITNRYLEQVNATIQSADVYLIDKLGNTIAASNWNQERTFIGRNYAWRPYFSEAILGQPSQYFALGSSSKQRGYYFSYPVEYAADVLGVIVVKMDLSSIEANWQSRKSTFVATDENSVVFMSSNSNWLFHSLTNIPEHQKQRILLSRQYLNTTIDSLGLNGDLSASQSQLSSTREKGFDHQYFISSQSLNKHPLTIRVLTTKSSLLWGVFSFALITSLVFVIIYLTLQLNHQRLVKKRQFEQIQSEAKQKLEFQVMERTAELHAEINERSKTEQALRQTQNELIQAAKLAVLGQMSASISHELNNPLAAIRSFADNGRRFLTKQKYEKVDENLSRISALTERMAKISGQLRSFARKTDSDEVRIMSIEPVIHSAIDLVNPQLKSNQVTFGIECLDQSHYVEVNVIQLEQVLINLLTNAIQALAEQTERQIRLTLTRDYDHLLIHIDDNGPGVPASTRDSLFEPFYTTKKSGLGLGLSISQQIITTMKGHLFVEQSPLSGARFTISLPLAQPTE